ncbi:MAG TPA: hypothetical protein VGL46_21585 [Pseudonocardiaceae bacterium]
MDDDPAGGRLRPWEHDGEVWRDRWRRAVREALLYTRLAQERNRKFDLVPRRPVPAVVRERTPWGWLMWEHLDPYALQVLLDHEQDLNIPDSGIRCPKAVIVNPSRRRPASSNALYAWGRVHTITLNRYTHPDLIDVLHNVQETIRAASRYPDPPAALAEAATLAHHLLWHRTSPTTDQAAQLTSDLRALTAAVPAAVAALDALADLVGTRTEPSTPSGHEPTHRTLGTFTIGQVRQDLADLADATWLTIRDLRAAQHELPAPDPRSEIS